MPYVKSYETLSRGQNNSCRYVSWKDPLRPLTFAQTEREERARLELEAAKRQDKQAALYQQLLKQQLEQQATYFTSILNEQAAKHDQTMSALQQKRELLIVGVSELVHRTNPY